MSTSAAYTDAKVFSKYEKRGAYHWDYLSRNLRKHNACDKGRYDLIVEVARPAGRRVLDVGCGDGVLSYLLALKRGDVTGIDSSPIAIEAAREALSRHKKLKCQFQTGSVYELPFADQSFDVVICSEVIEHLSHPEKLLAEINRVARPGGRVVITTPHRTTEDPQDPEHIQEFYPRQLQQLASPYFKHTELKLSHPWFMLELFYKRVFGKRIPMILINLFSILGWNPFLTQSPFRLYTQIVLLAEPKH